MFSFITNNNPMNITNYRQAKVFIKTHVMIGENVFIKANTFRMYHSPCSSRFYQLHKKPIQHTLIPLLRKGIMIRGLLDNTLPSVRRHLKRRK